MYRIAAAALAALGLGATAAAADVSRSDGAPDVIAQSLAHTLDAAMGVGSFDTFHAALRATGLSATLDRDGPFTVLAPTDEAFAALPDGTVDRLMRPEHRDELAELLRAHMLEGELRAADVIGERREVQTLAGTTLTIDSVAALDIGGASALALDIPATNGVIHVIDRVIVPN
jgi:uncharacterized surface protein with fasciclin (FAS1) repeats